MHIPPPPPLPLVPFAVFYWVPGSFYGYSAMQNQRRFLIIKSFIPVCISDLGLHHFRPWEAFAMAKLSKTHLTEKKHKLCKKQQWKSAFCYSYLHLHHMVWKDLHKQQHHTRRQCWESHQNQWAQDGNQPHSTLMYGEEYRSWQLKAHKLEPLLSSTLTHLIPALISQPYFW